MELGYKGLPIRDILLCTDEEQNDLLYQVTDCVLVCWNLTQRSEPLTIQIPRSKHAAPASGHDSKTGPCVRQNAIQQDQIVINSEQKEVYMIQGNSVVIFDFQGKILMDTMINGAHSIQYNKLGDAICIVAVRNQSSFIIKVSAQSK